MDTQIRLSAKTEKRLDFLATQTGRTKAFYIRRMIENGLDDLEDYYLATDVLERVRRGKEKIKSSAAVRAHLGLMPTSQTCERLRQLRGPLYADGGAVKSRWLIRRVRVTEVPSSHAHS